MITSKCQWVLIILIEIYFTSYIRFMIIIIYILLIMLKNSAYCFNLRNYKSQNRNLIFARQIFTINTEYQHSIEVKNSKFHCFFHPASTMVEATQYLNKIKDMKATHNCWAFRTKDYERSSDDGEPSGTAGRPMLVALESEKLINCVIVVIRYFGGIKLGTGGLIRAYGAVAKETIQKSNKIEYVRAILLIVTVPYDEIGNLYQSIQSFPATYSHPYSTMIKRGNENYRRDIFQSENKISDVLDLEISCPETLFEKLSSHIMNGCRGLATIKISEIIKVS